MSEHKVHVNFSGRIVFVGFGSIGQGVLPLILRHVGTSADRVTIVSADKRGAEVAVHYGVKFIINPIVPGNLESSLSPLIGKGDFLINVSVDVSSIALVKFCQARGALYLDTCIEPWAGTYVDMSLPASLRTNYALREQAFALRKGWESGPTAVLTHGANPGIVSHFVKQAMLNIAADTGVIAGDPKTRKDWSKLAHTLGIKVIHIAERDTQVSPVRKRFGEFVNTWSCDGFFSEGSQPCELGWGTHEKHFPKDGKHHDFGGDSAIYLTQPGAATRARTWAPKAGHFHGFAITHGESISIADYLTVKDGEKVIYRPTVHYAYHPCDDAVLSVHEFVGRNFVMQSQQRILMNEIASGGIDELGVLLAGHSRNAYWYGSQLSVDEARKLCPYNNATSLQVTVAVLSGVIWAVENPDRGIVEPDEMDFCRNLEICKPYLGPVVGEYTDWNPLTGRESLFPEDIDRDDPWQFKNVRV
ncbi:MAG: homospermidine synthase [Gammaproteobacteria bacterium]|nr:homospermidine synthase [Gammaproteobacteria bacterium]